MCNRVKLLLLLLYLTTYQSAKAQTELIGQLQFARPFATNHSNYDFELAPSIQLRHLVFKEWFTTLRSGYSYLKGSKIEDSFFKYSTRDMHVIPIELGVGTYVVGTAYFEALGGASVVMSPEKSWRWRGGGGAGVVLKNYDIGLSFYRIFLNKHYNFVGLKVGYKLN